MFVILVGGRELLLVVDTLIVLRCVLVYFEILNSYKFEINRVKGK